MPISECPHPEQPYPPMSQMSSNHEVCMKWSTLEHRQFLSRKTSIRARSLHLGLPLRQCGSLSPKPESAHLPLVIETATLSQISDSAFKPSYPFSKARKEFWRERRKSKRLRQRWCMCQIWAVTSKEISTCFHLVPVPRARTHTWQQNLSSRLQL